MAACQGALLLVDATRTTPQLARQQNIHKSDVEGIQAQSISVYHVAKERGVHIIPVLNKASRSAICRRN